MLKALTGLFALSLVLAAPAFAQDATTVARPSTSARTPNFFGSTGVLYTPNAYTQGDRDLALFVNGNHDLWGGGGVFGIGRMFEVGVGIFDHSHGFGGGGDTDVLANAKFNFLTEQKNRPAIAVGVTDAFDQLGGGASWYVVGSKYFSRSDVDQNFSLKVSLGYGGGAIFDDTIFASGELFFTRNLSAMAEFQNDNFNVGGRWNWKGWAATIGLFDLNHFGGGLSYTAHFR